MIHAISLAVIVVYAIYLEVTEGELDQTRKDDSIVEFWTVCDLLFNQILKYN